MVAGHGRLPAETIQLHYVKRIESFGLNFKRDIINSTNDGCSTMKKLEDLLKILMQLCLVHGLQLGIVKIFYTAMKKIQNEQNNDQDDDDEDEDDHDDDDEEVDDQDENDMSENETDEATGKIFPFSTTYPTCVRYIVEEGGNITLIRKFFPLIFGFPESRRDGSVTL